MQQRTQEHDQLDALESEFSAIALNPFVRPSDKAERMKKALDAMLLIAKTTFEQNRDLGIQLTEYVLYFVNENGDAPKIVEEFLKAGSNERIILDMCCLLYTSPSPRDS